MPASDRSIDALTFVTDHFRDIMRRRVSELAGLVLVTLALLGAIALATWSVQDPSLSHATQKPIHNLLGYPGAIFSDLAMQLLGLAAVLLLAPPALYGWRLLSHRPLGERWRGLTFIAAIFITAAFVSTLPRIGTWPLPTGLGGVCGDALLMLPALFIPLSGFPLLVISLISGLAAAVTLALAAGLRWPQARAAAPDELDEEDEAEADAQDAEEPDRASPWLGMVVHALLSWKA
jgi:S-DNA-T family DNA segregation ATPase FtsK/SpoIIIE